MRRFFRGRFFAAAVLTVCFLLGFLLNLAVDGGKMPHRQLVGTVLTPIRSGVAWCRNQVDHFVSALSQYDALQKENEELKRRVQELQIDVGEAYYDKSQNERLKELLSMTENGYEFEFVLADVVSVSSGGWDSSFSINAGTNAGIEKGDVVVSSVGLVGKVVEIGRNWAMVCALTDPQISVGATVVSTGDVGVTESTPELKAQGLCRICYLDKDSVVNRGDIVYTSGLGGVYPKGLPIGTVKEIEYDGSGLTLSAVLEPTTDFSSLREVYVITNFSEDAS